MSWLFINMPLDPISETFEMGFHTVSSPRLKHSMLDKKGRFIKPGELITHFTRLRKLTTLKFPGRFKDHTVPSQGYKSNKHLLGHRRFFSVEFLYSGTSRALGHAGFESSNTLD